MPAKRKAAGPAATPAEPAAQSAPEPTAAAGPDEPAADPADGDAAPLNRAERRARGKQQTASQPTHRGKVIGGKGPASSQRMWANRRSG